MELNSGMDEKVTDNGYVPIALALVTCDYIHRDNTTGKYTIVGTFNSLISRAYPSVVESIAVYSAVTEAIGEYEVVIRIVDVNEEKEPIASLKLNLTSGDPREVHELGAVFQNVSIPESGEYRIQFVTNNEVLLERKFLASLAEEEPEGE